MKHLKIFESFTSKYKDDIKETHEKYENELKNYLHELTDEFPKLTISFIQNIVKCKIEFDYSEFDKFKETAHQGIFDRIKDNYPGTNIQFRLAATSTIRGINQNLGGHFDTIDGIISQIEFSERILIATQKERGSEIQIFIYVDII